MRLPLRLSLPALMFGLVLFASGCGEDGGEPEPPYDLTTPSGTATAFWNALAATDTTALNSVVAPAAIFVLNTAEAQAEGWSQQFTSAELDRALQNVVAGATITVHTVEAVSTFAVADSDSPFPGSLEAVYDIALEITWAGGSTTEVTSTLRLSVESSTAKANEYRLVGMQELENPGTGVSFGNLLVSHLANQPPVAIIAVDAVDGEIGTVFHFDASASHDPDVSTDLVFRWGGSLVAGGGWTDWLTESTFTHTWNQSGVCTAKVQVRDRWGLTDTDSVVCTVTLPFASTPQILMANFKAVYEDMDLTGYSQEVLNHDYTFVLQAATQEQFGLPDPLLSYEEEITIAYGMFSRQPNMRGQVLASIEIQQLEPQAAWQDVPENELYFGGHLGAKKCNYRVTMYFYMLGLRYEVVGDTVFYVAYENVMHHGTLTPRYYLLGQWDNTSGLGKATENATWGGVKCLWG